MEGNIILLEFNQSKQKLSNVVNKGEYLQESFAKKYK